MSFSQRHLPHFHVVGQPLFVTFRLHDSLPQGRRFSNDVITSGKAFACMDRLLDDGRTGPLYLKMPAIAQLVADEIHEGVKASYNLHAWVIMPNHVHLLITPRIAIATLYQKLKGSTARAANQLLGRTGLPFWQGECYDRLVRNADEFGRIEGYILRNPIRAGLAATPEEYPWCGSSITSRQVG